MWHTSTMSIEQWWPSLKPSTREWLIENNGDEVPAEVVAEIAEAGGPVAFDPWWVGQSAQGFYFRTRPPTGLRRSRTAKRPRASLLGRLLSTAAIEVAEMRRRRGVVCPQPDEAAEPDIAAVDHLRRFASSAGRR